MADGSMVHKGIKGMSLSLDSICYMGFICIYIYISNGNACFTYLKVL